MCFEGCKLTVPEPLLEDSVYTQQASVFSMFNSLKNILKMQCRQNFNRNNLKMY